MSRYRRIPATLLLLLLTVTRGVLAQGAAEEGTAAAMARGQTISTAVSTITSVAVSPLLGVSLLGVRDYIRTPQAQRPMLPFYDSPAFWIPVGMLLILILLKDTVGGFSPLIKKPLDAVEVLLLNKASLLIIGIPVLLHQVESIAGAHSFRELFSGISQVLEPVAYAADAASTTAAAGHVGLALISSLSGAIAFVVVWLASHALDVLLLLSPFPFLDVLFKGIRSVFFGLLVGVSYLSKTDGMVLSVFVILVCALGAGWTLRLAIFGSVFAWDLLRTMLLGLRRKPDASNGIWCFAVGPGLPLRKRTFGRLSVTPTHTLEFRHRGIHSKRVALPATTDYEIGRGLLHPSLIEAGKSTGQYRILFRMLPGYLGSEELLREGLELPRVSDIRLPSGLRAFWRWLNDTAEA